MSPQRDEGETDQEGTERKKEHEDEAEEMVYNAGFLEGIMLVGSQKGRKGSLSPEKKGKGRNKR